MFSSITGFVRRHRRKFIITAGIIGGVYVAGKYLFSKLADEQEKEMAEKLAHARMKHHFESNQKTCTTTCISLLPSLRERILELLDTEEFTAKLKRGGNVDKLETWQQLKLVVFTRSVVAVYSICFLVTLLRVQLNVMGRYMYLNSLEKQQSEQQQQQQQQQQQSTSSNQQQQQQQQQFQQFQQENNKTIQIPPNVQRLYLSLIQYLLGDGLELLITDVERCVQGFLTEMSLKKQLTHSGLCGLFDHLRITLDQKIIQESEALRYLMPALSLQNDFFQKNYTNHNSYNHNNNNNNSASAVLGGDELRALNILLNDTRQILNTQQYLSVLSSTLDSGFEFLCSNILQLFQSTTESAAASSSSSSTASEKPSTPSPKTSSATDEQSSTTEPDSFSTITATLPLAKIIPLVSAQIQILFKVPHNDLIAHFSSMRILDQFSAVIYSAFDGNSEESLENNMSFTANESANNSRIIS